MEIAAELRAQGASWQVIAQKLKRQLALVHRWTTYVVNGGVGPCQFTLS
jgi:hypothetical protein